MVTRQQTNAKFRNEITEVIGKHESMFDQIHVTLQTLLTKMQSMDASVTQLRERSDNENPFSYHSTANNPHASNNGPPPNNHASNHHFHGTSSTQNPTSNSQNSNYRHHIKLQFPEFDSEDPHGWIHKAEQYFDFQVIVADDRVQLSSFHLKGVALQWQRWYARYQGPVSWAEFTKALLKRFGPTDYEDPSEALNLLRQTSGLTTYQIEFEHLSNQVDDLPHHFLVGCFIAGLKDEIRLEVKIKQPRTLADAIGVARLVEEKNNLQKKKKTKNKKQQQQQQSSTRTSWANKSTSNQSLLGPIPKSSPSSSMSLPRFRRISNQEAKERREKGLCYYCDEKYTPGHLCVKPQLFCIEDSIVSEEEEDDFYTTNNLPEISLHAIAGTDHPQTLRLPGRINGKEVSILVDSGSTHNFEDENLVKTCELQVVNGQSLQVMVANREKVSCEGRCLNVTLAIQGYLTSADFFVLPVAACPVVMGVQWLATLGPIETDYNKLTMTIKGNDQIHTFQGEQQGEMGPLSKKDVSLHMATSFLLQVSTSGTDTDSDIHPHLQHLISKYHEVFEQPKQLPPRRVFDHHIPLQDGSRPISVKPYRYPFYQKTELEKMVKEMYWRFCVDYRALNEITIKDKFPIPVIDELLDELYGSTYYTKLDLRSGYHQIRIKDEDIYKTAFRTHEGHYEFVVMPFGLTNPPATFQALMNDIFKPYLRKFILVFFDDILIYSRSWNEHQHHLEKVLQILKSHNLFVKASKCQFGVTKVDYLGHVISQQGVSNWPQPTNQTNVRGFLGLAGYYRKFIRNFGGITAPLTQLLTKHGEALSSPPILKPIAYFSEALKGTALHLSTYEKEMLAIVKAVRKWRPYLLGRPFIVRTDQRSLKFLLEQCITTPTQARWLPKLLGYDYKIEYKPEKENQDADALSCVGELHMSIVSFPVAKWWKQLQDEVSRDPFYKAKVSQNSSEHAFRFQDGICYFKGKIYLNPNCSLIPILLKEFHATATGGHFGYLKTLARLVGLLQPLPIPESVWSDVSMDFIEGLPLSKGNNVIMVVVDRLSKYSHFVPLRHPFSAIGVATEFLYHVVKLHGIPESITSDRDKTDGQTEVVNRILEQYLRCFTGEQSRKWFDWLPWAEFSYNTSYHSAAKFSPFEIVYGRRPPTVLSYVPGTTRVQAVDEHLWDRAKVLRDLKSNLRLAQERMKLQAEKHRREVEFSVGDLVYLKLQPYRQSTVAFQGSLKLSPRFYGPFEILEKIGTVAYKLLLPKGARIHNVFHVSLLRKHLGDRPPPLASLPPITEDSIVLPTPERILDKRDIKKGRYRPYTDILVKWVGTPDSDSTWENLRHFSRTYPAFVLEDKDNLRRED
ncbi:hypothetical protein K2173_004127 [Erythroxylum novogranatense]|uniref:RNA-directed DNA polymerase n=1 Tax=Erythroxylum novogranatense TaxID=1862640 RepID=A0AAV8SYP0_9ROSI|nr:hypothetical protein K2173_004127 [Erythroxylum novogranatense]